MAKNGMTDLRDHLFETIEGLKDGTITLDTAKAINEVGRTLIASAKVEVALYEALGRDTPGTDFFSKKTLGPEPVKQIEAGRRS